MANSGFIFSPNQPANDGFAITPNDSVDLSDVTRGIYVGGTGDIKITHKGGTTLTYFAVPVGTQLAVKAQRVWATGTTATNLVGMV
jgi:hypothetical protein